MDAARAKGMDVWMDSGMYTDWATYAGTATFDEQTIKDNSLRFGDMVAATGKYTGTRLNRALPAAAAEIPGRVRHLFFRRTA